MYCACTPSVLHACEDIGCIHASRVLLTMTSQGWVHIHLLLPLLCLPFSALSRHVSSAQQGTRLQAPRLSLDQASCNAVSMHTERLPPLLHVCLSTQQDDAPQLSAAGSIPQGARPPSRRRWLLRCQAQRVRPCAARLEGGCLRTWPCPGAA